MNEIKKYTENIFESIKHIDEDGVEYWYARELMPILQYNLWQNFHRIIKIAMKNCENSDYSVSYHFINVNKMINLAKNAVRKIQDYKLSRYACYLIVLNCDPRKNIIALAKTYFAIQTRRQELSELEYSELTEDEKRLYNRALTKKGNYSLNQTAKKAGVKNFDKFHNAGYKRLYNGESADDISKRKGLRYREEILDNMGSEELADNLFRIVQTDAKLKREKINGENNANITHYNVGRKVRKTIEDLGGTMPEDLPTPNRSLKELEKEIKKIDKNYM